MILQVHRAIFAVLPAMRIANNTVGSIYDLYRAELSPLFGASEARAMARTVFQEAFGWDMVELDARRSAPLSESEVLKVYGPLMRMRAGEPLQYVLGRTWFMGMELLVAPGVLIPRPETEEMVDHILRSGRRFQRILDVGTGSGCIALALKKHLPLARVFGMDVSQEALSIARSNGERLGMDVGWVVQDVSAPGSDLPPDLDLVVSNPPYIPAREMETLDVHVRDHEPHLALFVDDADPLLFYRVIARKALDALLPGGELWFEGHHLHAEAVGDLIDSMGYQHVNVLRDLSGSTRFIHAIR